jgi:hypothetical protein
MAVTAYFQPKFITNHMRWKSTGQSTTPYPADLNLDTLKVGLIKSTSPAVAARSVTRDWEFVSELLANNGSALTEENGSNYARQNLASVVYSQTALVDTLTSANPSWTTATISSIWAFFYDETASNATDATRPLIALWDFGGTVAVVAGTYTLQIAGTGIVTWTAAV